MPYSEAQRTSAIELVQRNGGVLDVATLDSIRAMLAAPVLSKQLVYYWIRANQKTKPESKQDKAEVLTQAKVAPAQAVKPEILTGKQLAFAEAYTINGFNATKAARMAQYSGDDHVLASVGYQNLRKPAIRAEVERLLAERTMGRNEVLARLAEQATADLGDFLNKESLPEEMRNSGKLRLLKKVKITNKEYLGIKTQIVELELHDPQAALVQLGRHLKLFTDKTELNLPDELMRMLPQLIDALGGTSEAAETIRELMRRRQAALALAEGDDHV